MYSIVEIEEEIKRVSSEIGGMKKARIVVMNLMEKRVEAMEKRIEKLENESAPSRIQREVRNEDPEEVSKKAPIVKTWQPNPKCDSCKDFKKMVEFHLSALKETNKLAMKKIMDQQAEIEKLKKPR